MLVFNTHPHITAKKEYTLKSCSGEGRLIDFSDYFVIRHKIREGEPSRLGLSPGLTGLLGVHLHGCTSASPTSLPEVMTFLMH